ncbi:hypothetical protein HanRHA438_Chr03g0111731 [Helianthus annuus]|nr:hypothetical protein HanIR_Chr03g0109851 [Helianthus annuus]KAJ0934801.1 hypothetical protein HanRHA438_Chr03g0111731 [Helianthus annuus]
MVDSCVECLRMNVDRIIIHVVQLAEVKKQTVFFLHTAEVWSNSSATDVCRCGPRL